MNQRPDNQGKTEENDPEMMEVKSGTKTSVNCGYGLTIECAPEQVEEIKNRHGF